MLEFSFTLLCIFLLIALLTIHVYLHLFSSIYRIHGKFTDCVFVHTALHISAHCFTNNTCISLSFLLHLKRWNPAAEMQAIDRTHRLGQYRPIRAVRFIAENTVEERILHLQEKKRLVFDGTVGRDAASLKMLSVDDMKALFN